MLKFLLKSSVNAKCQSHDLQERPSVVPYVKSFSEMPAEEQAAYLEEKHQLEEKWLRETAHIRAKKAFQSKAEIETQINKDLESTQHSKGLSPTITTAEAKQKALRDITGRGA